ncbi:hypothetical protein VTI28DRAFT_276 [Corynascus sepedonium]
MTITHVQQKDYNDLEKIATFLYAASKIVTLTGAGISTNAGIPCWDGVIDYWVEWDCDAWVGDLVERQQPFRCGNRGRQAHDQVLGIGKPYLQDARLILGVPVGPTRGDGRPDGGGQGSSRDNPIDLTL